MTIRIFTRPGCINCAKAKQAMTSQGIVYESLTVGEDVTREDVLGQFPGVKSLPIITRDGRVITLEEALNG